MRWAQRATFAGVGLAVLGGCTGSAPPATPGLAAQPAAVPTTKAVATAPGPAPLAWPTAGDCRSLVTAVLALPAAERARLDAAGAPLALAVADGPLLLHAKEVPAAVEPDLPVRVAEGVDGVPCLVVAERPRRLPGGERRLVGHEVVRSEFRSGVHRTLNPDYARTQEEGGEPRGGLGRFIRTGDPLLDVIGL